MNLENISKIFNENKENEIEILKNISLKFEKGKMYAIMGRSGAGKTTLVNIIGLLDTPTSGSYLLNGKNVNTLNEKEKAHLRNKEIGFVFQSHFLDKNLTAIENVLLPTIINKDKTKNDYKEYAIKLFKDFGLEDRINAMPSKLSGGEAGRVAIIRALINDPTYLIADEPTGALDSENETYIFKLLKSISKSGKCVIVVTHNDKIKKYADTLFYINDGVIKNG